MSLKDNILTIVKDPENDHISRKKVIALLFFIAIVIAIFITTLAQIKKNHYLEEQKAQLQQKRSQASDNPMASLSNEDTKLYIEKQTKLKNKLAASQPIANGFADPLANNGQGIPPIATANGRPITNSSKANINQNLTQSAGQDPIALEYQNEKIDKMKHNYASYRADTLVGPQPNNNSSQSISKLLANQDNSQSIPQPSKLANNQQPSNGFNSNQPSSNNQSSNSSVPNDTLATSDQNQQSEKSDFMMNKGKDMFSNDYINAKVQDPISKYEIKAGTPIPAFLITPINSDLPGMVTAQVARNIYDTKTGNYLLIPGGSKLIGVYDSNISYGQSRVMVAWNRVIFPSGSSYRLYGMPGTDAMGISGLTGEINNHYGRIYGSALVMGVITAGMQYSQNNSNPNVQTGTTYPNPTVGQSLSAGLGQQLGQAGLQVVQKNVNVQPTIEIPPSEQVNIMLTADVVLKPINKANYVGNGISHGS